MGIALILLAVAAAAVVVDFVVENDLAGAPDREFSLFGGSFTLGETAMVLVAAVLGALAVLLVVMGIGLARGSRGRRRALRERIADLERRNRELSARVPAAERSRAEPAPRTRPVDTPPERDGADGTDREDERTRT